MDGTYYLQATDRYDTGGADFAYIMEAFKPEPEFDAVVETDALRLDGGTTTSLKLTITRTDGYNTPLMATAADLPEGVTSTSAIITDKGDAMLILSAAASAKPYSGLFRVLVFSTDPDSPRVRPASASLDLPLPVGRQIIGQTDQLWLTIAPAQPKKSPDAPHG
jgi:hypothetical protein